MTQMVSDRHRPPRRPRSGPAHVVGHDWGGAIGAVLAALSPNGSPGLTCLSVGHPAAFAAAGWEQREKSWYMLLFQFPGIAERWLAADDFANLRNWSRHPDIDSVIERLRDPAALTASLAVYRAILPPESLIRPRPSSRPSRHRPWGSGAAKISPSPKRR